MLRVWVFSEGADPEGSKESLWGHFAAFVDSRRLWVLSWKMKPGKGQAEKAL